MSRADADPWLGLGDGADCPICMNGRPLDVIAEFRASWVTAGRRAPLPGYACVVSKRHVVEPFELPTRERQAFWEDAMQAAQALARLLEPIKLNYHIDGNTIPHLHMHLYPRFLDDPYVGRPIDAGAATFARTAEDLARMRSALSGGKPRPAP